jgi:hypothetical protein
MVYLTGYLDSLSYTNTVEWTITGAYSAIHNVSTGELHTADFPERGTFTYRYTRISECATSSATGKAYVHIPTGKIPPRPNMVVVCLDQAASINVSAIFGLALDGNWTYDDSVNPDDLVSDNTTTNPLGIVIFNGVKAYSTTNSAYNVTYRSVPGKGFSFEYDYSDCAKGKKKITIEVTN